MGNIIKKLKLVILLFVVNITVLLSVLANQNQKVQNFVNNTAQQVILVIDSNDEEIQKKHKLRDIFCNTVDISWMGKFALGKYYKNIEQKRLKEYLIVYKAFLINAYVSKFSEYNGVNFDIDSIKPISNSQYIVNTKVLNKKYNSKYINVSYRIKVVKERFLIRDIIAEDVSLILGQRSDFNSIISKEGIIGLIKKLKNKVT